jgi:hypothetical protein
MKPNNESLGRMLYGISDQGIRMLQLTYCAGAAEAAGCGAAGAGAEGGFGAS